MYEVYVQTHISSAHHLRNYNGECKNQHGHNWIIKTYVQCKELDKLAMGIDFKKLKSAIKNVCEDLDHADLNKIPYFKSHNPTSESVAKYLFSNLSDVINDERIRISKIEVMETPGNGAIYWE